MNTQNKIRNICPKFSFEGVAVSRELEKEANTHLDKLLALYLYIPNPRPLSVRGQKNGWAQPNGRTEARVFRREGFERPGTRDPLLQFEFQPLVPSPSFG